MAILNSLLVNGQSRFLGKVYAQDLEVSGTTSFQDISANTITASERSTFSGGITVGNYSNTSYAISTTGIIVNGWARTVANTGWYNQTYSGGIWMIDSHYVRTYGGKSFLIASGTQSAVSSAPESVGLYLGNNRTYYFREDGKLSANQLIGVQASVGTVDADNVNVTNVLRANRFDLQTISQAGGCILITPTVKYPNASTTLTVAKSGSVLTLTITDSSITSATMAGAVWGANSRVKVSGTINGIVTGTMDGTVTSINTTSHVLTLSVSGENSASVVAGSYTASQFQDLSVALYQRRDGSNDYRVGIWLNCYDTANESATIRIYGGTDSNPNVAIGNLTSMNLPQVNGVTPTGWSLYAANAYLTGTVVANAGLIGSWVIGERGIYYGSNVPSATSFTFNPNPRDQDKSTASIGGSASGTSTAWLFNAKDKFGIDTTGKVYCNLGQIGGFTIDSNSLKAGTWGENNSVLISTGTATAKSIGGSGNINNWVFTGGATFGVTKSGAMYASSGKIGPWTMTATSLYKGNATLGTSGNGNIYIGDNGLSMSNKFVYKTSDGTLSLNVTSLKIAGEDIMTSDEVASAIENSEAASSELIYGTQTAATSRWTGVSQHINSLYDGLQIRYWLPYAYSSGDYLSYTPTGGSAASGTGLTLTLSDGTNTDCIPCFYSGISRITSHYGAGNILRLTYRENVTIGSATVVKGWWADGNYDSGNTYDRTRYTGVVKTGTNALVAGNIIVGKDGIYQHLKLGQVFDVTMPIMYAASALAANQTNTGGWIAYINLPISITTTQSMTLTVGSPVYIKGTLTGNDFTPISTTPLTQTVPSEYDGYQYIYLGTAYSSGYIYLEAEHPIYMYFGTKFMPISEISKTYMYYDSTNGLVLSQNEVSASTDLANAGGNVRLTNSGMGIYSNNTQLANYGDTVTIGKTGTSDRNVYIDTNGVNIRLGTTNISSFGTDMTIGRTDGTNRNVFVDSDSGVSIRKGTTVLANYGDTITINHGTSGKKALTLDSTNGAQFYKLDGSTLAAQLNADGLTVSVGKIGNWVINSNGLYYTSATPGSTSITLIPGGTTAATTSIGGSSGSKQWVFTVKDYFGIDTSGNMFSKGGKIGGFDIGPSYLVNGTWGTSGSVMMSTGTSGAKSIGGSADTVTGWAFTAGNKFGVTNEGSLYANNVAISGKIDATSGTIGGFNITNTSLDNDAANSPSQLFFSNTLQGVQNDDLLTHFYTVLSGMSKTKWDEIDLGWIVGLGGSFGVLNQNGGGQVFIGEGQIAGFHIYTDVTRTSSTFTTAALSTNKQILSATNTTNNGIYFGIDGLNISGGTAATTSYITKNAVNIGNKLTWDGTTLSVTGSITANSGSIAGWTINSDRLSYGTPGASGGALISPAGYTIASSTNNLTKRFASFSGNTTDNTWSLAVSNNFGVTSFGRMYSMDANIEGGIIGGWTITSLGIYCKKTVNSTTTYSGLNKNNYAFYAGSSSHMDPSDAKCYITHSGRLVSTNGTETGAFDNGGIGFASTGYSGILSSESIDMVNYTGAYGESSFNVVAETNIHPTGVNITGASSKISIAGKSGNGYSRVHDLNAGLVVQKSGLTTGLNALAAVGGANGNWGIGVLETNDSLNFGYMLDSRTSNAYDCVFTINPTGTCQLSGQTGSSFTVLGTTGGATFSTRNNYRNIALHVNDQSNAGIYDSGNTNWILRSDSNQNVYIPHIVYVAGNLTLQSKNHGYYLTNDSATYPAIFENGSNMWIGASSTSGPHHIGGTFISAGHTGSAGNATIYVSVPNAANNGGSNYAVLHENNYSNYIKTVINYENGSGSPVVTDGTDGHKVAALRVTAATTAGIKSQKGTAGATAAWVNFSIGGSDQRLKENIVDSKINAISEINNIRMRSFDWKDSKEHWNVGFIAQEAYAVNPLLALKPENEDEEIWSINDFYITGLLTKAMQEEDSKVTKLEKQVSELEKENQELRQRIIRLEATIL